MEDSKARCCLRSGCFDCSKSTEYIRTEPVVTPYFHPVLSMQETSGGMPAPEKNYVPYDLFVFRSKFERMLYHFDPTYHFSFVSKELEGLMVLTIELYKGATFVPLSIETSPVIQEYVYQSVRAYPAHALVLDARIPILRGSKTLTKAWVASLIPFFKFEDRFHAITGNGKIYLSFKDDLQYVDRYAKMYMQILNTLFEYFERGIVPLSPRFHSKIIENFELQSIHDQYGGSPSGGLVLYEPRWRNVHIAPNPVAFLYDRIQGKQDLKILVGDNFVRRHFVAIALTRASQRRFDTFLQLEDYTPTFSGKYVLVPAENVQQAFEITDIIRSSQAQSMGKVELIPLRTKDQYESTVEHLVAKYKTLVPGDDIVMYKVIDVPEYVASFLLPTGMAVDSLKLLMT